LTYKFFYCIFIIYHQYNNKYNTYLLFYIKIITTDIYMSKDIFVFGTCRYCYPEHKNIKLEKKLRKYHSQHYKIGDEINIYTQPVNYTTKLCDILDSIQYMKGKLYNGLDVKTNIQLQSIFFRGHYGVPDFIQPNTHPNPNITGGDIKFGKIIIEIFSIKQYIINTKKYGDEFYLKKLPWKIKTNFQHNDIHFEETDFIEKHLNKEECFEILHKIKSEVDCEILIIGPYISRKVPDIVNKERLGTQNILKEFCALNNCDYYDMSHLISMHNIEHDECHISSFGTQVVSAVMHDFIIR
tara:strand:+ start:5622 stop:6512 length:891 start_codon:yes stop_codon:yes gene_type:complete